MEAKSFLAQRYHGNEETVWNHFMSLAERENAVDLCKGLPDFCPPDFVRRALIDVTMSKNYKSFQYSRILGHPQLVKSVADLYSPLIGRTLNPDTDILITRGALGALSTLMQAFLDPGDEIIVIEPFFGSYLPLIQVAGGVPVCIPLRPMTADPMSSQDFVLDPDELRSKFNKKTKLILFNNPNNPMGKVYRQDELEFIAKLCIEHNVVAISDEVYEFLIFPPAKHMRICTVPGMYERTLTVCSAGKILTTTGAKTGWIYGSTELMKVPRIAHMASTGIGPTPVQEWIAKCIEGDNVKNYSLELVTEMTAKRNKICSLLNQAGFQPILPDGGYFIMAKPASQAVVPKKVLEDPQTPEVALVSWLAKEKKLGVVPISVSYLQHRDVGSGYVRICFIKSNATIANAEEVLSKGIFNAS